MCLYVVLPLYSQSKKEHCKESKEMKTIKLNKKQLDSCDQSMILVSSSIDSHDIDTSTLGEIIESLLLDNDPPKKKYSNSKALNIWLKDLPPCSFSIVTFQDGEFKEIQIKL